MTRKLLQLNELIRVTVINGSDADFIEMKEKRGWEIGFEILSAAEQYTPAKPVNALLRIPFTRFSTGKQERLIDGLLTDVGNYYIDFVRQKDAPVRVVLTKPINLSQEEVNGYSNYTATCELAFYSKK